MENQTIKVFVVDFASANILKIKDSLSRVPGRTYDIDWPQIG